MLMGLPHGSRIWLAAGLNVALKTVGLTAWPQAMEAILAEMPAATSAIFGNCNLFVVIVRFSFVCAA